MRLDIASPFPVGDRLYSNENAQPSYCQGLCGIHISLIARRSAMFVCNVSARHRCDAP